MLNDQFIIENKYLLEPTRRIACACACGEHCGPAHNTIPRNICISLDMYISFAVYMYL